MDITITATATLVELTRNALQLAGGPVVRELWAGLVAILAENRASTLAGLLAVLAWGCAVLTLFALVGREGLGGVGGVGGVGARGGPAGSTDERVAVALPPRRLLTAIVDPAPAPAVVAAAAPVLVETAPVLVQAAAPVVAVPAVEVTPSAATSPSRPADASRPADTSRPAATSELPILTASRCRRCTQPRCWPSTGERPAVRTLGVSAPRGCGAPIAATRGARCLPRSRERQPTCGARGPFRELTPVHRSGPPRGRGPRRIVAAP